MQTEIGLYIVRVVKDIKEFLSSILRSFPPEPSLPDRVVWPFTKDGVYSLKSGICKPPFGKLKCNIHSSWLKEDYFCGGAWILRNVVFHARDAFLPS
ncbi:hypothetical protein CARUB_v10002903mg [Capsella rubella]|uniref:Uncharacterized protein n=1 Tax=Capsella rubella TaxID=81985 RepID=R0H6W6_9BRAS|nr:hypothetical protein CARUB_v10002903mg [Capsella rubella]